MLSKKVMNLHHKWQNQYKQYQQYENSEDMKQ